MAEKFDTNLDVIVASVSECRSKIDAKCDQLHAMIDEFREKINEKLESKAKTAVDEIVTRRKKVEDIHKMEKLTASLDSMAIEFVSAIENKKSKLLENKPEMFEIIWNDQLWPNFDSLANIELNPIPAYKLKNKPVESVASFSATFSNVVPERIAIDKETEIIGITDSEQNAVHLLSSEGHTITTITHSDMTGPYALCLSRDKVYVTDTKSHYVFIFDAIGKPIRKFGGKGRTAHRLHNPSAIAVHCNGKEEFIYVCDTNNNGVSIFNSMGACIKRLAYNHLITPIDVKLHGNCIYVLHSSDHCVWVFNSQGMLVNRLIEHGETPGVVMDPKTFELDTEGNFYVVDRKSDRVKVFNPKGKWVHSISNGGEYKECLDVAVCDNEVYVLARQGTHAIHKY